MLQPVAFDRFYERACLSQHTAHIRHKYSDDYQFRMENPESNLSYLASAKPGVLEHFIITK